MTAVNLVINAVDEDSDILPDSMVTTTTKKKSSVLTQALMRERQVPGASGNVKDLYKLPLCDYYKAIQRMEEEGSGQDYATSFCGRGTRGEMVPFRKARMLITIHEASYHLDGQNHVQLFSVLWVVCHRNFDFVGKLHRVYGNPATWRQQRSGRPRLESEGDSLEAGYAIWSDVMLQLISAQRFPVVQRSWERRCNDDPMSYLCSPDHPESLYALSNPCAVYNSITLMCPTAVWGQVKVSGMAMQDLDTLNLNILEYLCRFEVYRKMFTLARKAQKAAVNMGEEDEGEDIDGAENEDGEVDLVQEQEHTEQEDTEQDVLMHHLCEVGADKEYINAALMNAGDCEVFDDQGRASLAALLGWPKSDCTQDNLRTGIPHSSVTLTVDFMAMSCEMVALMNKPRREEMQKMFGGIPHRAKVRIQNMLLTGRNNLSEDIFLMEAKEVSEAKRRRMYQPTLRSNPLEGYMYDKAHCSMYERFGSDVIKTPDQASRLVMLTEYMENMMGTLRGDLMMGRSRSNVLMTTQMYVDALEREICTDVWNVTCTRRLQTFSGSDFEVYTKIYYGIFEEFNNMHWNLSGRNMHLVMNLIFSELLWRYVLLVWDVLLE